MPSNSTTVRILRLFTNTLSLVTPTLASRLLERLFLTPIRRQTPQRELDWMAGALRSDLHLEDGRKMPMLSWGAGPIVVLAHGWAGRGTQLGVYIKPLVAHGYRVVAFDAPGHGAADGAQSSLPELAMAIQRVVEEFGSVEAIVAHSLGTAATSIALAQGLPTKRVVYISPPDDPGKYLYRVASFLGFRRDIAKRTQERLERRFDFRFQDAKGPKLASQLAQPLLIIHSRDDKEVPYEEGQHLAEAWPNAGMMTTDGLGHYRILRDPQVVDAAVRFVTGHA